MLFLNDRSRGKRKTIITTASDTSMYFKWLLLKRN